MRRRTFAIIIAVASGSSLLGQGAAAQWWDLPDGIDNPRPRYYDYHPPGVFYGDAGPVGFAVPGYVAAPDAANPANGTAGYGYGAPPYPTAGVVVPIAPRPLCGVYRYWRDGVCLDRRGY